MANRLKGAPVPDGVPSGGMRARGAASLLHNYFMACSYT